MKTKETLITSFEDLLNRFGKNKHTWSMVHCAVNSKTLWKKYKHHYIVLGHKWKSDIKVTIIIHYTKVKTCTGKVSMEHYTESDFRRDIDKGLVVLEDERYISCGKGNKSGKYIEELDISGRPERNVHVAAIT